MTLLILGLALFIGAHVLATTPLRTVAVARLGEGAFKGLFSVVSLAGLILAGIGYGSGAPVQWHGEWPIAWTLSHLLLPVAAILLVSAYRPGHIRAWVRHPMMVATFLWALLHLLGNGDRESVILFGAFTLWSLYALVSGFARGKQLTVGGTTPRWQADAVAVGVGLGLYAGLVALHGWLTGVALW